MKNRTISILRHGCLALGLGLMLHPAAQGQSSNSFATRSYDTALTSDGFGVYHLAFPKFSPDSGTLVAVKLVATVNSQYGFTLRNADSVTATYQLILGQQDSIEGPQMPAGFSNTMTKPMGSFPLNAGQEVTQVPFGFLSGHVSSDSITAVAPFMGSGQISLTYRSFTFTSLTAVNNATYYYSAGISNNMTFSVQYVFAPGAVLATDLTAWTATRGGPQQVQLNWATANETAGRTYVIQRSSDNQHFGDIATLPAAADGSGAAAYTYPDDLTGNADSSWYYRLQIHDATGMISYSAIRQVSLTAGGMAVRLYPNPAADFINIVPGGQNAPGNYQVDILAVNGTLLERNTYTQTSLITITFKSRLSPGTYFARVTDLGGQSSTTVPFVVLGH